MRRLFQKTHHTISTVCNQNELINRLIRVVTNDTIILTDVDGTLIDTETAWRKATLKILGHSKGFNESHLQPGYCEQKAVQEAAKALNQDYNLTDKIITDEFMQIMEQEENIENTHLLNFLTLWREKNKPLAWVTNSSHKTIQKYLELDIPNFKKLYNITGEENIFTSDALAMPKPSPEGYTKAYKSITEDVTAKNICILEDSETGIESAIAFSRIINQSVNIINLSGLTPFNNIQYEAETKLR